jgi:error-prone DNA polymerase
MAFLPDYAELHCISNFTFLRGASHAEELVACAAERGYSALAITDECSLAGIVRAHVAAKEHKLKLLVGTELALDGGMKVVLIATSRRSYGAISALITLGRRRSPKGEYALARADLEPLAGSGVIALLVPGAKLSLEDAHWLAERFSGDAWVAVELHYGPNDHARLVHLANLGAASGLPLVAAGDVHMHVRSRRQLQDILTAIRLRKPVAQCGHALYPNAERHLRARVRLAEIYPPELLAETVRVAERCAFSLDELRYEYPEELVPEGETPASWLRKRTERGLARRYPCGVPGKVTAIVERELRLIADLRYEPFFLTVDDIVEFARSREILCQGRGSAANSAVCYALGITEVDPDRMSVLFERFISKERNEPPDIDVDFEHQRREEVIQYVYGKYGRDRAAIAATVIRYQHKSAVRDVGKSLDFEPSLVDRLAQILSWWDGPSVLAERLLETGLDPNSPRAEMFVGLVQEIYGFPRHLSQHVGGFVISRGPLAELVPTENAAMVNRTVIEWDKDDLEALGLLKVDVLALGMLSAIRRALRMVSDRRGLPFGMEHVPPEDSAVYEMIQRADTIGVFQIESRAQMSMLPRLKPACFYDLVIEVAIIRPGPIQGGMIHPFLKRRQGKEPITFPSKAVEEVLSRTLGIPIFQEQVMQLAIVAAGFTAGEADQLRRAMAAWKRKGGLEPFEKKLKEGMKRNGYAPEFAEGLFKQILGFGEYGFPESHSASFALLVYVSAWIKCYEPAAFLAALLNSQPMGFYGPSQLVQDARRHGVEVRAADATVSTWDCTLEGEPPAVRLGLRLVSGLSEAGAERLVAARARAPFESVEELAHRATLDRKDLKSLASANALAALVGNRRNAHWAAAGVVRQNDLLNGVPFDYAPVVLKPPTEGDEIVADYGSVGLTLGRHPLALLRASLRAKRFLSAEELRAVRHGRTARAAGLVTCRQRPGTASGVVFLTLEDETGCVNVVVWNALVESQRRELLGARLLGVEGVVEREGDVVQLVARRLIDHTAMLGTLRTESRDFH